MRLGLIAIAFLILLAGVAASFFFFGEKPQVPTVKIPEKTDDAPRTNIIASDLNIPWDIAFLPDGSMLVTERVGNVLHITEDGEKRELNYSHKKQSGEGGLLGIVLHPDFKKNNFVYIYMSAKVEGGTENRVVRFKYENEELVEDRVIVSGIPGATYHDGGRIEFGPDKLLYITTGDATKPNLAQSLISLGGKVLRVRDDGAVPTDNPYGTAIYSYGHRNPQGLAWDKDGNLWETEHGPTGELGLCCRDEVNLIVKGGNFGWPEITATEAKSGMRSPALTSGESGLWAPASVAILGNRLFFGGLRSEILYEATIENGALTNLKEHLEGEFGRIRTVRVGPDGMLYITTSNRDGRGGQGEGMDKIVRINPDKL